MTATWAASGSHVVGTASCSPGFGTGGAAGDVYGMFVEWGNSTDEPPATPDGFIAPPNNVSIDGPAAESFGIDTGNRGISFFYRVADGTENGTTVTVNNGGSGGGRMIGAQIARLTKTEAEWFVSCTPGGDDTRGTGYSATGQENLASVNGDVGVAAVAWTPDSIGLSGASQLVWDGVNTSVTQVNSVANAQGNDVRFLAFRRNLQGNNGSPPVWFCTAAGNVAGATLFVLFHDGAGAPATQDIAPSGIASTAAVGSPTATPGDVTVSPSGIGSTSTVGQPAVAPGGVSVAPSGIESTTTVGEPALEPGPVDVAPGGIDPTAAVGEPIVATEGTVIAPAGIDPTAEVGSPTLTPGVVDVAPTGIDPTVAVGAPALAPGAVDISPAGIDASATVGEPVVDVEDASQDVLPSSIDPTTSLGSPTITPGPVDVAVPSIDEDAQVGTPAVTREVVTPPERTSTTPSGSRTSTSSSGSRTSTAPSDSRTSSAGSGDRVSDD